MIIQSDFHIHSEYSYDATLPLDEIASKAKEHGFLKIGITDHANYNDEKFLGDLKSSAENVKAFKKAHPEVLLGVELTPIAKPEFDYIAKHGTREGYVAPATDTPFAIELAQTKEELMSLGVSYAIGASHWRVDGMAVPSDVDILIREWYRQQLWLACDERVTVLGHPWHNGQAAWYDDFAQIPHSMHDEIAAALKENGKYAECNAGIMYSPKTSEKYRYQYAEFLRELFEKGIPITYGSDSHKEYKNCHPQIEEYLRAAGFRDGDFSEIADKDLWI